MSRSGAGPEGDGLGGPDRAGPEAAGLGGPNRVRISHLSPPRALRDELAQDVSAGLTAARKSLPPKYFYDKTGSALFEEITRVPEYYLTRAETEVLETQADAIVAEAAPIELVELGSGSSRKTRLLLEAMHRRAAVVAPRYIPLDVSHAALHEAAEALANDYPWLEVEAVVGDFQRDIKALPRRGRRLIAFLGSTIGNLERDERSVFLKRIAGLLAPGDRFLLGVDLTKEVAALEAAYDDAAGVTAAFNRNLLAVLNRELGSDLPLEAFEHVARYDRERACVDMFLRATREVVATFPELDLTVRFAPGEELHTEVSCKFTRSQITQELGNAGLALERWLADHENRFALVLAAAAAGGTTRG
ncbi:MAG: L-histidine N(alpha)-methyltransferase [Actinomycetota bacterium]|nr:L-histidine N(alpha)-methyltransferase [Actinomycetota bacterium]